MAQTGYAAESLFPCRLLVFLASIHTN